MVELPSRPAGSVAARLEAARARAFVGRAAPLELFRAALAAEEAPFSVLFVHGPGGVGKTTLLRRLAAEARAAGAIVLSADGHAVEPTERQLLHALSPGAEDVTALMGALGDAGRVVVTLDTYEALAPLDDWVRETLAPALPAGALLVLAGRDAPRTAWRADPGWSALLRTVALRNLSPEESGRLLGARGVAEARHAAIHAMTYGHPLALALVADLGDADEETLATLSPGVSTPLLGTLLRAVPSERHRAALEIAALARVVDRSVLAELAGDDDGALHAWLHGLSFVDATPEGLFVHDVVRDALVADAAFRDGAALTALRVRVANRAIRRLADGAARDSAALDLLHVYRGDPRMRPYYDWAARLGGRARLLRADELPGVLAVAREHEGEDSAEIARAFFARRPDAFLALEDVRGDVLGYLVYLKVEAHALGVLDELAALDPVTAAARRALDVLGPAREGEQVALLRFWLWRDRYQELGSAAHGPHSAHLVLEWTGTSGLGPVVLVAQRAEAWRPFFERIRFAPLPGADARVAIAGRTFHLFARDFRRDRMGEALELAPETPVPRRVQHVLSQEDFASAVRSALRSAARPRELEASPLLGSRVLFDWAEDEPPRAEMITELLEVAASSLDDPKDDRPRRAVELTFLRPAPTQELAAERLGLTFSTYRRQLARGVEGVTRYLWEREISGVVLATASRIRGGG